MKGFKYSLSITVTFILMTGCFTSPYYEVEMPQISENQIPAIGGTYSFDVALILTRIHVGSLYQNFEYKVSIDGVAIHQDIVNWDPDSGHLCPNVEEIVKGSDRYLRVTFNVPENLSSDERSIVVETLTAKDYSYYEEHVDPGRNTWVVVWKGMQAGV